MGKASSAKKVARAARTGGGRRVGQRRALGFPLTLSLILVLGVSLVAFARDERQENAKPEVGDHWHAAFSMYTCVPDTSAATTTTTLPGDTTTTVPGDTTTTTVPGDTTSSTDTTTTTTLPGATTSTTVAAEGDVPAQFQPHPGDVTADEAGIHTHNDGVIHIHPFAGGGATGRKNATMDKFFPVIGLSVTDADLLLPTGDQFIEGQTKCQGGEDGEIALAMWDSAEQAATGAAPDRIFRENFGKVPLAESAAYTLAYLPPGSTIPAEQELVSTLEQLGAIDSGQVPDEAGRTTTTTVPESETSEPTEPPPASDVPAETGDTPATSTTAATAPGAGSG